MSNLTSCDFYTPASAAAYTQSWQGGTKKWNFMTPYTISVMGCTKGLLLPLVKTSKQRYDLMILHRYGLKVRQ